MIGDSIATYNMNLNKPLSISHMDNILYGEAAKIKVINIGL